MSEYWTTFATYGDPNGQPFPHSNAFTADGRSTSKTSAKQEKNENENELNSTRGVNISFSNGYVEGTRVDSQPWWPSLLGDPPKPSVSEIHQSGRSVNMDDQDQIQTDETNLADSISVEPIELTVDPVQSIIRDSEQDIYTSDSTPIIRSALGSGDSNHNNKWATAKINLNKDKALPDDKTTIIKPKETKNVQKGDSPSDSTTTKRTSAFDILIELSTNKNQLHKYSPLNRVQFMHQMVFDEESSVNIIENDCICNQWNELGYRF